MRYMMTEAAVAVDHKNYTREFDLMQSLLFAKTRAKKSFGSLLREMFRFGRKPGYLTPAEYFSFQLYDDTKYSDDEKRRFISSRLHQRVIEECCEKTWWSLADDKNFSYTLLAAYGAPIPHTQSIYSTQQRDFGGTLTCRTPKELSGFLANGAKFPLFCKPIGGIASFGVFLITGFDETSGKVTFSGREELNVDDFCNQIEGGDGYLLQNVLNPHPVLKEAVGDRVSTVRIIILMDRPEPEIIQTIWKIPGAGSIADNYWREGNMLGAVNSESGKIERVVHGSGFELVELTAHPDTGKDLLGLTLPDWDKTVSLCLKYARVFHKIRYQSWDIALCPDGPVVVEVNTGSAFDLSQLATGEGFLTDRFQEFLKKYGVL